VPVELLLSILAELALSIFAERIAELLLCFMAELLLNSNDLFSVSACISFSYWWSIEYITLQRANVSLLSAEMLLRFVYGVGTFLLSLAYAVPLESFLSSSLVSTSVSYYFGLDSL
jgi:hypothetical protein